jgi:hypothetical protein
MAAAGAGIFCRPWVRRRQQSKAKASNEAEVARLEQALGIGDLARFTMV